MTISCLDSRYSNRIKEILPFLGEEAFVYYMALWSITYAESTNSETYLPPYDNKDDLFERVLRKEQATKHQMTALIQVLEEDFPNIQFHFGLTSEDIMHNARTTQMSLIINEIYKKLRGHNTRNQSLKEASWPSVKDSSVRAENRPGYPSVYSQA